jgi:asparagine synthase (glutamine-hydrolysing)
MEYSDRMSMAHSLEVRPPYTDHKLVEYVYSIPFEVKMKHLRPKYLLKKALTPLVPHQVLNSSKVGLNPPMGLWLKGELSGLLRELLSEKRLKEQGYFSPAYIKELMGLFLSGKRDLSLHLWALMVFEVWHQIYLDGNTIPEK